MIYAIKRGSGELGLIKSSCVDGVYKEVELANGDIVSWHHYEIARVNEYLDEIFNRIVIITGPNNYQIKTKYQFGKLNWNEILADVKSGRRVIYGAVWYKSGLRYIATLSSDGSWKVYNEKEDLSK